jgi:citrate synthase
MSDVLDEVDEDAYNIEAKYLKVILLCLEDDVDPKLAAFLDEHNKNTAHDLIASMVVLINKLARSSRIKPKFLKKINGDMAAVGTKVTEEKLQSSDLVKILNDINRQISKTNFFSRPGQGIEKVEGPGEDKGNA